MCQSWKLAATTISPSICRFNFETTSTTSPFNTVVLFHTGASRVEDTTYLGRPFNLLGQAVQPLRQRAASGWPPGGQELVAPPAQQKSLGAERLVECHLRRLFATPAAYATNPATVAEALNAGRVLDYSVERDVLADDDLSHFGSPFHCR